MEYLKDCVVYEGLLTGYRDSQQWGMASFNRKEDEDTCTIFAHSRGGMIWLPERKIFLCVAEGTFIREGADLDLIESSRRWSNSLYFASEYTGDIKKVVMSQHKGDTRVYEKKVSEAEVVYVFGKLCSLKFDDNMS